MTTLGTIELTLFGKLNISYQGESVELSQAIGKQLVTLLEMLAYYRHHPLSKETIIDTLWTDNVNPSNVMKFSVFRLRNYLKSIPFLADVNLICTGKNGYMLNPEYAYIIDTECFDRACDLLKAEALNEDTISSALELLDVYNGDIYLSDANNWSIQASSYYRSIYQEYVRKVCVYYQQCEEHEAVLSIALKASKLFPDHEDAHYYYLKSLIAIGDFDKALEYYNAIVHLMVHDLKIPISERMRKLYHMIMTNNESLVSIDNLQQQLLFAQPLEHAFFCEYDVFEYLFHEALRRGQRTKIKHYILLIGLSSCDHNEDFKIMNKLKRTISVTLRSVDVFTKVNKLQFCVLANCVDEEAAHIAAQRVISNFYKKINNNEVKLIYHINNIDNGK